MQFSFEQNNSFFFVNDMKQATSELDGPFLLIIILLSKKMLFFFVCSIYDWYTHLHNIAKRTCVWIFNSNINML